MDSMYLRCQKSETRGEFTRRACVVERQTDELSTSLDNLWIDVPVLPVLPAEEDAEPFLIMALLPAMSEGRDLRVEGAVSKKLLSNLKEFHDIWHSWNPKRFKNIEISVCQLLDPQDETRRQGAVAAFSGGVDSTFSVWRHQCGAVGKRSLDLRGCLMVHGFDVPHWNEEAFKRIFSRCAETLNTLDLVLYAMRTNCRSIFSLNWEIWHGPALAACLQLFKGQYASGIIASTYDSKQLVFPWGSNPITDPLLGTDGFEIVHDGIASSRIQKITAIRQWDAGYNNLRVCFSGIESGIIKEGNCGKCPRCLITLLRIQSSGLPVPRSFPGPPSSLAIFKQKPSAFYAYFWRAMLQHALKTHQRFSLILALAWISLVSFLALVLKKSLQAAGIWEPSF